MVKKQNDHLSDYERAIFYHTIPRTTSPITVGAVTSYSSLLLVSFIVLAYGLRTDRDEIATWGAVALGIIIVLGIVAFLYHSFLNQFAERKAMAAAEGIPDADSQFDDIPDPFADHVLLRYPLHPSE